MGEQDRIDDLLRTVGEKRSERTPEEIAEAERRIRELAGDALGARMRRLRTVGTVLSVIGFVVGIWPVVLLPFFLHVMSKAPPPEGFAPALALFAAAGVLQIGTGFTLFAGGLGLRKLRDWGRKLVLAVIWIAVAFCVGLALFWDVMFFRMEGLSAAGIPIAIFALAWSGFLAYLLWLAKRYFSSDRIREICGRPARTG